MAQDREDCYFYYYSTCKKEEKCPFRHEPLARGSETICEDWEFAKCMKEHCSLRHARELVNRSSIACYWESQPAGCQKAHCAFRHTKPRKPHPADATIPPTDDLHNVPSPKIDQVLIQVTDTDEDSPQKTRRKRPPVSLVKKVANDQRADTEAEGEKCHTVKNSSQALEEELLEFAKKGICVLGGSSQPLSNNGNSPARTRSLKDIKREKILRARLQYERKRQQATQLSAGEVVEKEKEKVHPGNLPVSQPPSDSHSGISKQNTAKKRPPAADDLSEVLEAAIGKALRNDGNEIKVKSFSEIMEEKRQRLSNVPKEMSANTPAPVKSVIAPRKINIRSACGSRRKPVHIQRPAAKTRGADVAKVESKDAENDSPLVEDSQISSGVTQSSPEKSLNSPAEGQLVNEEEVVRKTAPISHELDVSEELDLLGNSAQFSSGMTADIDDDDLMNEMDQLLA